MTLLSRRHALLGSMLLGAGCAPQHRAEVPRVPSAERLLGDPLVLGPDEGVIAGVSVMAFRLDIARGMNLALERPLQRRFILADAADRQVSIPLRPPLDDTSEIEESGVVLWITPFALKLPAGRHRLIGYARPAPATPTGWLFTAFDAPLDIMVTAGQAVNLGGIGQLDERIIIADRAARDAACPAASRMDNAVHGPMCDRGGVPFLRHDMVSDRAQILARFPALGGLSLVDRPLAPTVQWPLWPDVLLRRA